MRQPHRNPIPFIGLLLPFVGPKQPRIRPFIGQNRPLVRIGPNSGFTLIELIVTLVIAAILLTLAAPSMTSFIQRDRLTTQANDLVADLSFARSEAVKRGALVSMCKSDNVDSASPSCKLTAADPWTTGRIIWVDTDTDDDVSAGETVLRLREALEGKKSGNRMITDGIVAGGVANLVVFTAIGTTTLSVATPPNKEWILCDNRGASEGVAVALSVTGRARITEKGKDFDDNALSC